MLRRWPHHGDAKRKPRNVTVDVTIITTCLVKKNEDDEVFAIDIIDADRYNDTTQFMWSVDVNGCQWMSMTQVDPS